MGNQAVLSVARGADQVTGVVAAAYGPRGRNACIQPALDVPRLSSQGSEIAKDILLPEQIDNAGCYIAKEAIRKMNERVGDGGSSAAIVLQALLQAGYRNLAAGANPQMLRRGLLRAGDAAAGAVDLYRRDALSQKDILSVARSAGGDDTAGDIVADVVAQIGVRGMIRVEDSQLPETTVETTSGLFFDKGYLSSAFINNDRDRCVELERPMVLLYGGDLTEFKEIHPLLEYCARKKRALLILAKDVKGEALRGLVINVKRGVVAAAAVSSPGFGPKRERNFQSLEVLCQGRVFHPDSGISLPSCGIEICGHVDKAIIHKSETVLQGLPGLNSREAEQLREKYRRLMEEETKDYEKEAYEASLAYLSGGMAVIRAGGVSEIEMFDRKNRLENAVKAVRSATQGGVVPGGGVGYLLLAPAVEQVMEQLEGDERTGAAILKEALSAPLRQLAKNSGADPGEVLGRIVADGRWDAGYDFAGERYVSLLDAGIVDPAELVKAVIETAVSAASMILTVGAHVLGEEPKTMQTQDRGS